MLCGKTGFPLETCIGPWEQARESSVESDSAVGAGGEEPRLRRVEDDVQDAQIAAPLVTAQHFQWHNCGVLQQIAVRGKNISEMCESGTNESS